MVRSSSQRICACVGHKEWHQAADYQCRYQIQLLFLVTRHFFGVIHY